MLIFKIGNSDYLFQWLFNGGYLHWTLSNVASIKQITSQLLLGLPGREGKFSLWGLYTDEFVQANIVVINQLDIKLISILFSYDNVF